MEFPWGSPIPRGEDYGIIAEPYFDLDFDEVFYLTDTGRRWDGDDVSVRDKVEGTEVGCQRSEVGKGQRSDVGCRRTKRQRSEIRGRRTKRQRPEVGGQITRIEYKIVHTGQHYDYEMSQAFLFMIYRKAIKALRRGGDVVSQALILGGITAMTAALIHCQFDYLFYLPSNAVVFMVIAGMTYRLSN